MIHSYGELDDRHIDILREIGNIGAGNAATSLSMMIDEGVRISTPNVMVLDYDSVVRAVGDPEDLGIAIMIRYIGDVRGIVLFMLEYEDAKCISELLIGAYDDEQTDGLSDMMVSTIKEIGNILGSSYLGSIATMTGLSVDISIPYVSIDMVGAIMSSPLLEFSIDNNKIMLIEESFVTDTRSFKSHVILFADIPSLNRILSRLGLKDE